MSDGGDKPWWRDPRSMGPTTGRWAWRATGSTNNLLRYGIPLTACFGAGFLLRLLFAKDPGLLGAGWGVGAAFGLALLAAGIWVERKRR